MTPEQMEMNLIKPIIKVRTNEELDTEKGESNTDEPESTISNKEEEEYSTFSDMSKQNSESDISVDQTQDQVNPHTSETLQIHNIYNTTMHDKDDLIQYIYDIYIYFSFSLFISIDTPHYAIFAFHFMSEVSCI